MAAGVAAGSLGVEQEVRRKAAVREAARRRGCSRAIVSRSVHAGVRRVARVRDSFSLACNKRSGGEAAEGTDTEPGGRWGPSQPGDRSRGTCCSRESGLTAVARDEDTAGSGATS